MNKQKIFIVITILVIAGGVLLYFVLPKRSMSLVLPEEIIFYYGDTCSHCKRVEEYIVQHTIHDKISFVEKEVYNDQNNRTEFTRVIKKCNIGNGKVIVPVLWHDNICLVGDKDIIEYLRQKSAL